MTISRLSGNRVLIFLGTGDLRDYALDFSRMNASVSSSPSAQRENATAAAVRRSVTAFRAQGRSSTAFRSSTARVSPAPNRAPMNITARITSCSATPPCPVRQGCSSASSTPKNALPSPRQGSPNTQPSSVPKTPFPQSDNISRKFSDRILTSSAFWSTMMMYVNFGRGIGTWYFQALYFCLPICR